MIKTINLILFAAMVYMNYLANALPLNGKTTGQLSEQYPNLFVPAGITFSIWGVIYLMLLVFAIIQFFETNKDIVQAIGWAFALSCLLNILWIVAWHYELLPLSLAIMIGLLLTLIFIGFKLQPYPNGFAKATFGIYLAWICIATIANFTAILVHINWGGWGIPEHAWAIIMIVIGVSTILLTIKDLNNPFIGFAAIWAFFGIVLKRQADYQSIVIVAVVGIIVLFTFTIMMFFKSKISFLS